MTKYQCEKCGTVSEANSDEPELVCNLGCGFTRSIRLSEPVGCLICANGNDIPEGEYCRACGFENDLNPIDEAFEKTRGRNSKPCLYHGTDTDACEMFSGMVPCDSEDQCNIDSLANEDRALAAKEAVRSYCEFKEKLVLYDIKDAVIGDLITDLLHYADLKDKDEKALVETALMHYQDEKHRSKN